MGKASITWLTFPNSGADGSSSGVEHSGSHAGGPVPVQNLQICLRRCSHHSSPHQWPGNGNRHLLMQGGQWKRCLHNKNKKGTCVCRGHNLHMLPESANTIREVLPFIEPPRHVFPDVLCWSCHVSVLELDLVTGLPHSYPYSADANLKLCHKV